ncbi:hypothetical protein [Pararobbsia alpina]|uniref:hypothetical protein n=1 Tax=Pararobbsia alpina TaxID=621374 RepID=UPI0039A69149
MLVDTFVCFLGKQRLQASMGAHLGAFAALAFDIEDAQRDVVESKGNQWRTRVGDRQERPADLPVSRSAAPVWFGMH